MGRFCRPEAENVQNLPGHPDNRWIRCTGRAVPAPAMAPGREGTTGGSHERGRSNWMAGDPVPFWLPVVLAIIAFIIAENLFPGNKGMVAAAVQVALFFLLCALMIIIPLLLFRKKIDLENTADVCYVLIPAARVERFCLAYSIFHQQEMMIGHPWPHAADRFPFLVGWLMDGVIQAYHATDFAYAYESQVYGPLMAAGFYLEVILVSGVLYTIICFIFPVKRPGQDP